MLDNLTSITFEFIVDEKNQTSLKHVSISLTVNNNTDYFPNYASNVRGVHAFSANESLFVTDRNHSYRCNTKTKIDNFQASHNFTIKSIDLENLRIQPFVNETNIFINYAAGMFANDLT